MRAFSSRIFSLYSLLALLAGPVPRAFAAPVANPATVSAPDLTRAIDSRIGSVEEFRFIQDVAHRLGVRAWLFGGTASGFGHYVKWDLQRSRGDPRFQKDRFDYDYTNIYRSTQDLDLVIDGTPDQAKELQRLLEKEYPHFQGSKTAWEVRLLRQGHLDKIALLDNPDFLNQHTDSNSTGMIELTPPAAGESRIRDLREWNSADSHFLRDLREGQLHYYFSPGHERTARAAQGLNPPILSVIRYFTKLFQYELTPDPRDLDALRKIIAEFDPTEIKDSYVRNWIEKNGKKLIQHAVNIEYAFQTLREFGLTQKLIQLRNDADKLDSLAWWLSREPLATFPLGRPGPGRTARELGLDIVAHETKDFLAYESITRAHTGDPNVLISRNGALGETAAHGDGFYTRIGRNGARNTGFTIRFHLHPDAREGEDFIRSKDLDYVIIRNKAALRVIPESLQIGLPDLFSLLAADGRQFANDRGSFEKFRRKIPHLSQTTSPAQLEEIRKLIEARGLEVENRKLNVPLLLEWFRLPASEKYPEIWKKALQAYEADPMLAGSIRDLAYGLEGIAHWRRRAWRDPLVKTYSDRLLSGGKLAEMEFKILTDLLPRARRVAPALPRLLAATQTPGRTPSLEELALEAWFLNPASRKDPELFWQLARDALMLEDGESFLAQKSAGTLARALKSPLWGRDRDLTSRLWRKLKGPMLRAPKNDYRAQRIAGALLEAGAIPDARFIHAWLEPLRVTPLTVWLERPESLTHTPGLMKAILEKISDPAPRTGADSTLAGIVDRIMRQVPHWRDSPEFHAELLEWASRTLGVGRNPLALRSLFFLDGLGMPGAWERIQDYARRPDPKGQHLVDLLHELIRENPRIASEKHLRMIDELILRDEPNWNAAGRLHASEAMHAWIIGSKDFIEYLDAGKLPADLRERLVTAGPRLAIGVPHMEGTARSHRENIRRAMGEGVPKPIIDRSYGFLKEVLSELTLDEAIRMCNRLGFLRDNPSAGDVVTAWYRDRLRKATPEEVARAAREVQMAVTLEVHPRREFLPRLFFSFDASADYPELALQSLNFLSEYNKRDELFSRLSDEAHRRLVHNLTREVARLLEEGPANAPLIEAYLNIPGISTQKDTLDAIEAKGWPELKRALENARGKSVSYSCATRFAAMRGRPGQR